MRKERILESAILLSKKLGYMNIRLRAVAKHAKVSQGLVSYYFKSSKKLKREVLKIAMRDKLWDIVAQATLSNDPAVPSDLKICALIEVINA